MNEKHSRKKIRYERDAIAKAPDMYNLGGLGGSPLVAQDTPFTPRDVMLAEMARHAVAERLQMRLPNGDMPVLMDMKRIFISCNRAFSITVRFEFHDLGDGSFGCGVTDSEKAKVKHIDQAQRMFLN